MVKSPNIVLSGSEQKELNNFMDSTKDTREFRASMGVWLRSRGQTVKRVAEQLHVSKKQVFRWSANYKKKGVVGLQIKKQTGRPSIKGDKAKKLIPKLLKKDPQSFGFLKGRWVVRDIAKELKKEGVNLSFQHVSLLLHDIGVNLKSPKLLALGSIKKKSQET